MASGKVKWFDNKKGFGFYAQIPVRTFLYTTRPSRARDSKTLNEGDEVSFEVSTATKG